MEALSFKRPAQEHGRFKFFKNNKQVYESREFVNPDQPAKHNAKVSEPFSLTLNNLDFRAYPLQQKSFENFTRNISQINEKLSEVTPIITCKENLTLNRQYQELDKELESVLQGKEEIKRWLREEKEKDENRARVNQRKFEEIQEKIQEMKEEKKRIEDLNAGTRKVLKFFKEFSGLEILDAFQAPLTLNLKVKHEAQFIQFKLIEENEFYEYTLISASIDFLLLPPAFQGSITFEKDQFKVFYEEIIEFIVNYE